MDRLRDGDYSLLEDPAQRDLRRRLLVAARDADELGDEVHAATHQRCPRLQCDIALATGGLEYGLLEARVELALVDGGHDRSRLDELIEVMRVEVAHADGTRPPACEDLLHRHPCVSHARRPRPVDEVEVNVVHAELAQTALERGERRFVALIGVPELRCDEQLVAWHAAFVHDETDALLVAVKRRCVDEPIAHRQAVADLALDICSLGCLVRAETEPRHVHARRDLDGVGKRDEFEGGGHARSSRRSCWTSRMFPSGRTNDADSRRLRTRTIVTTCEAGAQVA